MSLFVISDLHLSLSHPEKSMEIFGGWKDYINILKDSWQKTVSPTDTVVIPGDITWATHLNDAIEDFSFLNSLNGFKILGKGNHDYFWTTQKKVTDFFKANDFDTLHLLYNNFYKYEKFGICGTRGWIDIDGETINKAGNIVHNDKIMAREVQRLEVSISLAEASGLVPIVFLHYPPIFATSCNYDILDVLYRHNIRYCYYGHLHGAKNHEYSINGERDGIEYHLISGDFVQFQPVKIM
ncbi:MAG: metallophosphoesterase [Oscillospiraceae bacterium]